MLYLDLRKHHSSISQVYLYGKPQVRSTWCHYKLIKHLHWCLKYFALWCILHETFHSLCNTNATYYLSITRPHKHSLSLINIKDDLISHYSSGRDNGVSCVPTMLETPRTVSGFSMTISVVTCPSTASVMFSTVQLIAGSLILNQLSAYQPIRNHTYFFP